MAGKTTKLQAEKMQRLCDYIYQHLDYDLSIAKLSDIANFSKYHFHRQFSAYVGISVFKFIQYLRLKRAAHQLVFNEDYKLIDIALDAGFKNPESFSRAFKKTCGQTPSQFRNTPEWKPWHKSDFFIEPKETDHMTVTIVNFPETKVGALEHRGAPDLINHSLSTFIQWRKESGLSPKKTSRNYGIAYDDPKTTAPEKFRFDLCGTVEANVPENDQQVITKIIPQGRCAVVRYHGSLDHIGSKVCSLYSDWLPKSGEELRDFPCFFHYLNIFPKVEEHARVTDIYLPLK